MKIIYDFIFWTNRLDLNEKEIKFWDDCKIGDVEAVEESLNQSFNKEWTYDFGSTPFYVACFHGHVKVVKLLIESGMNIEKADKNGSTPFHVACKNGHLNVVKLLVKSRINVETTNNNGWTALEIACLHGRLAIVSYLLYIGVEITDDCFEYAIRRGLGLSENNRGSNEDFDKITIKLEKENKERGFEIIVICLNREQESFTWVEEKLFEWTKQWTKQWTVIAT